MQPANLRDGNDLAQPPRLDLTWLRSIAAERQERKAKLEIALDEIEEIDREVLALRHFEQLSNAETASLLELSETAASNRYIRALKRLKSVLERPEYGASVDF